MEDIIRALGAHPSPRQVESAAALLHLSPGTVARMVRRASASAAPVQWKAQGLRDLEGLLGRILEASSPRQLAFNLRVLAQRASLPAPVLDGHHVFIGPVRLTRAGFGWRAAVLCRPGEYEPQPCPRTILRQLATSHRQAMAA